MTPVVVSVKLKPVEHVEIAILVDNHVDILLDSDQVAQRPPLAADLWERDKLQAEHGYAVLVTVSEGNYRESVLYDAGLGPTTALHNLDVLGTRTDDIRAILLSHGHPDHHGGLEGLARRLGQRRLPLILHPDAWQFRRLRFPTGNELPLPPPRKRDLESTGVEVVEERGPTLLLDDRVLLTGEVARTTDFEQGFPIQEQRRSGRWEPDPWVWDDQALVVDLAGKGLIVVSSCSHAGIINIVEHARRVTGVPRVHAVVGGFHLGGRLFAPLVSRTVEEMRRLAPDLIVPGHCTGWQAEHALAAAFPTAFIKSSVGTRLLLE